MVYIIENVLIKHNRCVLDKCFGHKTTFFFILEDLLSYLRIVPLPLDPLHPPRSYRKRSTLPLVPFTELSTDQ